MDGTRHGICVFTDIKVVTYGGLSILNATAIPRNAGLFHLGTPYFRNYQEQWVTRGF
jgi:hypothetical protein